MSNIDRLFSLIEKLDNMIQEIVYISDSVTFSRNTEKVRLVEKTSNQSQQIMELNVDASKSII